MAPSITFDQLHPLIETIDGCTFASLDTETLHDGYIVKRVQGTRVILFTNKLSNGYENKVRRHLEKAGLDPDGFRLDDLPWGARVPNTPFIIHNGNYYLQTIVQSPGYPEFFTRWTNAPLPDEQVPRKLKVEPWSVAQGGLTPENQVKVRTYALSSIKAIRLKGEEIVPMAPSKQPVDSG